MKTFKVGASVRMNKAAVKSTWGKNSKDHIKEFGKCIGIVVGPTFADTDEFLDVRWQPSNLRYSYAPNHLEPA